MRLHVIASGSKGNASIIENPETGKSILIDCGICKRTLFQGFKDAGVPLTSLQGIFITHDHSDHTKGLGVATRGMAQAGVSIPIFTTEAIVAASIHIQEALDTRGFIFEPYRGGESIVVGGMRVLPFQTSHDAVQSFGFRIETEDAIGYLTDSGCVTPSAHANLLGVRILAIESNHDVKKLETGPYPLVLKKRVGSDLGHLSNDQAISELALIINDGGADRLEHVVAMHVSQENNSYGLAKRGLQNALVEMSHPALAHVAYQEMMISVG